MAVFLRFYFNNYNKTLKQSSVNTAVVLAFFPFLKIMESVLLKSCSSVVGNKKNNIQKRGCYLMPVY